MSSTQCLLADLPLLEATTNTAELRLHIANWFIKTIADSAKISHKDVDLFKSFDDFGLDSIKSIRLVGNLSDWLGEEISPNKLYQFSKIDELIEHIYQIALTNIHKLSKQTVAKTQIVVAASFTAEPVADFINYWAKQLTLNMDMQFAPYNQIFQQLISPNSQIRNNKQGVNIILFRIEDWFRYSQGNIEVINLNNMVETFIDSLAIATSNSSSKWVIVFCPHSFNELMNQELQQLILEQDQKIIDKFSSHAQVRLMDLRHDHNHFVIDKRAIFDLTRDKVGHIPFTQEFFAGLGLLLTRTIFGFLAIKSKVIVLDCDNTLWSGVCGEDEINSITISTPFKYLQKFMLEQQQEGKLLCLCSKNIEADVWTVFDKHPDMILKREHITSYQINWDAKSHNLKKLAIKLNLGLDSFIFIDDNPVECAEVSANVPGVLVLQLPKAVDAIPSALEQYWPFDNYRVTNEDRSRQLMYQQNNQREELRVQSVSYEEFLIKLNVKIKIQLLQNSDIKRAAQLTERTNQFNATSKRRTETEIEDFISEPNQFGFAVHVSDSFGDYGFVGLILAIINHDQLLLESFMLSCRVLGKKVEHNMLTFSAEFAAKNKLSKLCLICTPSPRNQPLRDFYASLGYNVDDNINNSSYYSINVNEISDKLACAKTEYNTEVTQNIAENPIQLVHNNHSMRDYFQKISNYGGNVIELSKALRSQKKSRPLLSSQYVSARSAWQIKIANLWSEILGIEKIGINDNFYELGGDSLRSAELAARLSELGVPDNISLSILTSQTVASLAQVIEASESGSKLILMNTHDSLESEAIFKFNHNINTNSLELPTLINADNILLTGSTGYVGAFLLRQLLVGTNATIYCLVRAKTEQDALSRISKNLACYDIWQDDFCARIRIILGDLAQPYLGLSNSAFNQLSNTLDLVLHNGAWVNFIYPYQVLKPANVEGTKAIIDLVTQGKTKPLHFISTLGVLMSGSYGRDRILFEDENLDHSEDLPNGYEQTKWVADKIVWRAMQQGLPASIYRLGMLSGLSNSGVYHKLNEFLPSFLKGCIQLGSFPQIDSKIEMVPIDFITEAFFAIASDTTNIGKVYQMNHPTALYDHEFVEWIRNFGYPLRHLPWDIWKKELLGLKKQVIDNALYPYLDFIRALQYHQTYMPEMNMNNFMAVVKQKNINCLPQTQLLHNYFTYFIKSGYLFKQFNKVEEIIMNC